MRIGELARRTATRAETIRYYERIGLLPAPARTSSNYRTYSEQQVARLDFIRRCRGLGMSLGEIGALLQFCDHPLRNCDAVNRLLEEHVRQVETRIAELQSLARQLRELRTVCRVPGRASDCGILQQLRLPRVAVRAVKKGRDARSRAPA